MTKSIEEQAMEYSKESLSMEQKNILKTHMPDNFRVAQEMERMAYLAGAKARDAQWSTVVNELRDSLSKILPEVYCLYQQETGLRLDKVGEKYDTVKIKYDRSKLALTKADQMLKEMGI